MKSGALLELDNLQGHRSHYDHGRTGFYELLCFCAAFFACFEVLYACKKCSRLHQGSKFKHLAVTAAGCCSANKS